jgi:hypothetical protein
MNSTVQWKPIGQVNVVKGSLVFPKASTSHGIYWFAISEGPDVVAGYIGQTGRKNGLAGRFGNYRNRGNHPRDQHGKAVPLAARDDQLGTTSLNARRMLRAIEAGNTVAVSVLDGPDLADGRGENAWRDELEIDLIQQLCRSGVEVWNVAHVVGQREVRVLTVISLDPEDRAAREADLQLIPEELRNELRRITDALPLFKDDFEGLAIEIFNAGCDFEEEYRTAMAPCEPEEKGDGNAS